MPRGKRIAAEQIIAKLREAEVELAQGKKVPEAAKKIGITEQTYYRWKKKYGGLRVDSVGRTLVTCGAAELVRLSFQQAVERGFYRTADHLVHVTANLLLVDLDYAS